MKLPRIILADDHALLTDAFKKLLEPNYEIVGVAMDGISLVAQAPALRPDLILLDLSMPRLNGLEAARQLRKAIPRVRIMFVTMVEDGDIAMKAMHEGAVGYLLKKSAASELLRAIQVVLSGGTYVSPQIAREMEQAFALNPHPEEQNQDLTSRERQVLQLLAEGKSMKEAASILSVKPRTIAFHKYRIMETLRLHTNSDLIRYAVRNRIVFE